MPDHFWRMPQPQDAVRRQALQDREWLHSRRLHVGVLDALAASVVLGLIVIGAV